MKIFLFFYSFLAIFLLSQPILLPKVSKLKLVFSGAIKDERTRGK